MMMDHDTTDTVVSVVVNMIEAHLFRKAQHIYCLSSNLRDAKSHHHPFRRRSYVNVCLTLLRNAKMNEDPLRYFNVLFYNDLGEYLYGHPCSDGYNNHHHQYWKVGIVFFRDTGIIDQTSVTCTENEYNRACDAINVRWQKWWWWCAGSTAPGPSIGWSSTWSRCDGIPVAGYTAYYHPTSVECHTRNV